MLRAGSHWSVGADPRNAPPTPDSPRVPHGTNKSALAREGLVRADGRNFVLAGGSTKWGRCPLLKGTFASVPKWPAKLMIDAT